MRISLLGLQPRTFSPQKFLLEGNTVYCFLFAMKEFHGCKSFPSFPEKYLWLCRSAYYNWPSYNMSTKVLPKNFRGHEVIREKRETFSPRIKSNIR